MPKIAEIESTPNPNAKKFILKEPLTWGVSRSFDSPEAAQADALASALFAMLGVTNVFYVDHWITVTQDGSQEWASLLKQLAVPIRDAPSAEASSEQLLNAGDQALDDPELSEADRLKLSQIIDLLDEQVRPFLQGDGGDLHVMGLEGKTLKVHYQGACGSCPSSLSATLTGIQGLVRTVDPELEVVPV